MPSSPPTRSAAARRATGALVLATVGWGMGFVWAQALGAAANAAAGRVKGEAFGPVLILALRFSLGTLLWGALLPASRRGWGKASLGRGLVIGGLMFLGLVTQHLGLDVSDPATVAFLTNLTVVFVPLMVAALYLRWPTREVWIALVIAGVGIWLLTGKKAGGFGRGEWLTLGCAVLFSAELIVLDRLVKRDTPARMTLGMFASVAALSWGTLALVIAARPETPRFDFAAFLVPAVFGRLALLACFTTVVSFGLMTYFQPKLDPTRAALIYLFEPIFTAIYAYYVDPAPNRLTRMALFGAALILAANVVAESKFFRRCRREKIVSDPSRASADAGV